MFKNSWFDFLIIFVFILAGAGWYFYTPQSVTDLHQEISSSPAGTYRPGLSKQLEKLLMFALPKEYDRTPTYLHLFLGHQRKYLDLEFKQVLGEIRQTKIPDDQIRVWTFANMGAVVKSGDKTIAFDIADVPLSKIQKELVKITDVFLVTHADSDHFDTELLDLAIKQNKTIILPANFGYGQNEKNVLMIENAQTLQIGDITITAWQTDHRGNGSFSEPNAWYLVNVNGFNILHTGDGRNFVNQADKDLLGQQYNIDIFLANYQTHPHNIRDVSPKVVVPMHLFKYMHSREELEISTFEAINNTYEQYPEDFTGIEVKWLFPGESFTYQKK